MICYAIVRRDMDPYHAASQACHAVLATFVTSPEDVQRAYCPLDESCTKIVLVLPGADEIENLYQALGEAGIHCFLWTEPEPVGLSHVTALGIGPVEPSKVEQYLKDIPLN